MKYLLLVFSLLIFTGISGCDETADIQGWVDNTSKIRLAALKQAEVTPYRNEQHKALKAYYAEINQMALALKNDSKFRERFNGAVAKANLKEVCSKVFVTNIQWQTMMTRCTRNRFFLCAEEVRAYPSLVAAMRDGLFADQQKRFDQADSCRVALIREKR